MLMLVLYVWTTISQYHLQLSLTTDISKHIFIRMAIPRKVPVQRKRTGKVQQFTCHDCKFQLEWTDLKF
jgi:transposase-like protein